MREIVLCFKKARKKSRHTNIARVNGVIRLRQLCSRASESPAGSTYRTSRTSRLFSFLVTVNYNLPMTSLTSKNVPAHFFRFFLPPPKSTCFKLNHILYYASIKAVHLSCNYCYLYHKMWEKLTENLPWIFLISAWLPGLFSININFIWWKIGK